MLQSIDISSRSLSRVPSADTAVEELPSTVFSSGKNDRFLMAGDHLELALLRFLEAEPTVQSFETLGSGAVDVRYWGGLVVVAVLPSRGKGRRDAEELKRSYEASGRRLVLVPEARLTSWPTRDTCRIVSESGRAPLTPTERLLLIEALQDAGGLTCLGDLAILLHDREDPVASVLSLVVAGMVRVDLRSPLTSTSQVSLFDPLVLIR